MFCDQSGFYLLPMVVRTYAPVGKTPISSMRISHEITFRLWAASPSRRQTLHLRAGASLLKGEDALRFLKHLMRQIPGKLLVIWEGSPIHRGRALKDFLASGASPRLQLEQLPFSTLRISTPTKESGST